MLLQEIETYAQNIGGPRIARVLAAYWPEYPKTFFGCVGGWNNPRQEKVLLRMFEAGPSGFLGGMTARKYIAITTQKPQALLERLIAACTIEGNAVVDCYCGCERAKVALYSLLTSRMPARNWLSENSQQAMI